MKNLDNLKDALYHPNPKIRRRAIEDLAGEGEAAVPILVTALRDEFPDIRQMTVTALGKIAHPSAIQFLIPVLGDVDADVRRDVMRALRRIGTPATEPLMSSLNHTNRAVRAASAYLLGDIGEPRALPLLIDALVDQSDHVRKQAAVALGKLKDPASIPALIDALSDPSYGVQESVSEALKLIGAP
ncbi:MAG TPA: HEAT repeat domain-containing protein, partial [Anaerolineales bacterium]|nr:HEAT repeat domain-containing protein [Anaerolineales bacterium]